MLPTITRTQRLFVKQTFELGEVFGFETRNKYRICDEAGNDLAFAAEQQKGIFGFLLRQLMGHWRTFEIHFFSVARLPMMIGHHPFRWFFQRIELREVGGRFIGLIERRFSIFSKRFDVQDSQGQIILQVASPLWRFWTFPFFREDRELARISKKWTGLAFELFTDKDSFLIDYLDPSLTTDERALVLTAAIYIDLMFFEKKASGSGFNLLRD